MHLFGTIKKLFEALIKPVWQRIYHLSNCSLVKQQPIIIPQILPFWNVHSLSITRVSVDVNDCLKDIKMSYSLHTHASFNENPCYLATMICRGSQICPTGAYLPDLCGPNSAAAVCIPWRNLTVPTIQGSLNPRPVPFTLGVHVLFCLNCL